MLHLCLISNRQHLIKYSILAILLCYQGHFSIQFNKYKKILLKTNNPYKGHEYIKDTFNKEVNNHLKNVNIKNPNSVLSKIIWPYVEISPSSENKITDDLILKIKEIKLSLNNNNLENALSKITNIENHEKIFELSYLEISKYLDFKNELLKLK